MAPGVLDVPAVQFSHDVFAGVFPIVPDGHAANPEVSKTSILDPFGTIKETDPPGATIFPASTSSHIDCCGLD